MRAATFKVDATYTELLGFDFVQAFSSPAGDFIFLHSKTGSTSIALQDANKETYGAPLEHGGIILGFAVEDADSVYRDWQSKSIEILLQLAVPSCSFFNLELLSSSDFSLF